MVYTNNNMEITLAENGIKLSSEEIKKIIRYESNFKNFITEDPEHGIMEYSFSPYTDESMMVTLEDLLEALKNIKSIHPEYNEYENYWRFPLGLMIHFGSHIDVYSYADDRSNETIKDNIQSKVLENELNRILPDRDDKMKEDVWKRIIFDNALLENKEEGNTINYENLDDLIEYIEVYQSNKDKPAEEWEYSAISKQVIVKYFDDNDLDVSETSELLLEKVRAFADELCEKDHIPALRVKGYSQYGGNRLYDCDWRSSRDIMEKLYELTDDSLYSNTLGYIYYYGRCSDDGQPEYEKAFRYFYAGHLEGLYESSYKIADMLKNGYGCKQSYRRAYNIYKDVYLDNLKHDNFGMEGKLADAALRMGTCYEDGIYVEKDLATAYGYYLEAEKASKTRLQNSDFFGDASVAIGISKSLDRVKSELQTDFFLEYLTPVQLEGQIHYLTNDSSGYVTVKKQSNGIYQLIFEREYGNALVTIPELDMCEITGRMIFTCRDVKSTKKKVLNIKVKYDWCIIDEDVIYFYQDLKQVLTLKYKDARYYPPKAKDNEDKMVTLATVTFDPDGKGRTYDYICNITGIEPGDTAIVETQTIEKEVYVKEIYSKKVSDLPIPVERYRRILRKA